MRLRQPQRRQPPGLQFAGRTAGVRQARRAVGHRAHAQARRPPTRPRSQRRPTRSQARIRELFSRTDGTESMAGLRKEMMDTMEEERRHLPHRGRPAGGRATRSPNCASATATSMLHRQEQRLQHRPVPGAGTGLACSIAPRRVTVGALARKESRGAHQRLDLHRARRRELPAPHAWSTTRDTDAAARRLPRRGDHQVAARRARLFGRPQMKRTAHGPAGSAALQPGDGQRAALPALRRRVPGRMGGARCAERRQGNHRPDAELPLVLPHGGLRQLRHDGQRRAQAGLPGLPARLPGRDPGRAAGQLPDRARPGHGGR